MAAEENIMHRVYHGIVANTKTILKITIRKKLEITLWTWKQTVCVQDEPA